MVRELSRETQAVLQSGRVDPFMLAAKYCTLFVFVYPIADGNGRMCRILMNIILSKYVGIVIPIGETESNLLAYLDIAVESRKVGGHPPSLLPLSSRMRDPRFIG